MGLATSNQYWIQNWRDGTWACEGSTEGSLCQPAEEDKGQALGESVKGSMEGRQCLESSTWWPRLIRSRETEASWRLGKWEVQTGRAQGLPQ